MPINITPGNPIRLKALKVLTFFIFHCFLIHTNAFDMRGSKVSMLNNSNEKLPERKSAIRHTVILSNKKSGLDHKIFDYLVDDDFALLEIICHGSLAGDSAAVASKGILCMLETEGANYVNSYLRRLLQKRVLYYSIYNLTRIKTKRSLRYNQRQ